MPISLTVSKDAAKRRRPLPLSRPFSAAKTRVAAIAHHAARSPACSILTCIWWNRTAPISKSTRSGSCKETFLFVPSKRRKRHVSSMRWIGSIQRPAMPCSKPLKNTARTSGEVPGGSSSHLISTRSSLAIASSSSIPQRIQKAVDVGLRLSSTASERTWRAPRPASSSPPLAIRSPGPLPVVALRARRTNASMRALAASNSFRASDSACVMWARLSSAWTRLYGAPQRRHRGRAASPRPLEVLRQCGHVAVDLLDRLLRRVATSPVFTVPTAE